MWYYALGQFDMLDDLALIKRIRGNGKVDKRGMPLADPESLPEQITENGLMKFQYFGAGILSDIGIIIAVCCHR